MACSQFRCRDFDDCTVNLFSGNEPIIEKATNVKFGPYNLAYPGLDKHCVEANLNIQINKWDIVFDFTKNKETGALNYSFIPPEEWKVHEKTLDGVIDKPI